MTSARFSGEVQGAINRLNAGGRLYVIEERPYPYPHTVVVVLDKERYSISFNDFAFMSMQNIIQPTGSTIFEGFPAEEYVISPNFEA